MSEKIYFKATDEESVAEFMRAFQQAGLKRVRARLKAHPGKSLREIMVIEGSWNSFVKSSIEFGKEPESSCANLEARARANA